MPCRSGDRTSSSLLDCAPLQPAWAPAHYQQASQLASLGDWHAALKHSGLQPAFCFGGRSLSVLIERDCDTVIFPADIAIDAALA